MPQVCLVKVPCRLWSLTVSNLYKLGDLKFEDDNFKNVIIDYFGFILKAFYIFIVVLQQF